MTIPATVRVSENGGKRVKRDVEGRGDLKVHKRMGGTYCVNNQEKWGASFLCRLPQIECNLLDGQLPNAEAGRDDRSVRKSPIHINTRFVEGVLAGPHVG